MRTIVNVLLDTLNFIKNHGINIVIVKHGSVINQISLLIVVNYLFNAWTTVIIVLMRLAVISVLKISILMVMTVNTKILLLYA
jgi:predicted membrane chloride channel (bestrophin family)